MHGPHSSPLHRPARTNSAPSALRPSHSAALLSLCLTATLLAGCAAPTRTRYAPPDQGAVVLHAPDGPAEKAMDAEPERWSRWGTREDLPDWVGRPRGWERMMAIESWLRAAGSDADPYWTVEGQLQLAEGRLAVTRREAASDRRGGDEPASTARVHSARSAFRRVLESPHASNGQRERARAGLGWDASARRKPATRVTTPSGVLPRSRWGARPASAKRMRRNQRGWRRITVHHSAMQGQAALTGQLSASADAIARIQHAHMSGKGYGDIGYHFLIDPAGRVFVGRELAWQGAHAGGTNNVQNIGICLLGNFERQRPTQQAVDAMLALIETLREEYGIPRGRVSAHLDWKSTECPGRHLLAQLGRYR